MGPLASEAQRWTGVCDASLAQLSPPLPVISGLSSLLSLAATILRAGNLEAPSWASCPIRVGWVREYLGGAHEGWPSRHASRLLV